MSVAFGPLDHYPGFLERKPRLIDMIVQLRDRPNVSAVRLWVAAHPHHLYGERAGLPDSLMNTAVPAAASASRVIVGRALKHRVSMATSLLQAGHRIYDETRGTARFIFDPDEVAGINPDAVLFFAIQQERSTLPTVTTDGFTGKPNVIKGAVDTADNILGPIFVLPTAGQLTMAETTLIFSAQAPATSAAFGVAGTLPVPSLDLQIINPMHIIFPRPTTSLTIRNTDAAQVLRVSHGLGQQIYEIPLGTARTFFGSLKEICVQSAAAALCDFSVEANINLGGAGAGV